MKAAFLYFILFVALACRKSNDTTQTATCKPVKYTSNYPNSFLYRYEKDKFTQLLNDDNTTAYVLEYDSANRLKNINNKLHGYFVTYKTFGYNPDGTLDRIAVLGLNDDASYKFHYTNGRLTKVLADYSVNRRLYRLQSETTFTYTGNDITTHISKILTPGYIDDTAYYTYDTLPNRFTRQNSRLFLYHPGNIASSAHNLYMLPFYYSEHNVLTVLSGQNTRKAEYVADDKGNLKEFHLGNFRETFEYSCK